MEEIIQIINKLRLTSGTNDKVAILKKNADNELLKKVLEYTYNDNKQYGFSEKKLIELLQDNKYNENTWEDGFDMLDILSSSNINDSLRINVNTFLKIKSIEEQELWICILTKDLKIGMSKKLINKGIPKLIPEFNIQQSYPISKYPPKKGEWFVLEEKLNGINCSFLNDVLLSRQGKEFTGLKHIKDELNNTSFKGYYFNGELVRRNPEKLTNGENFRETTSIVNSDEENKDNIDIIVFDLLPIDEFFEGKSKLKYKDRLKQLRQLKQEAKDKGLTHIHIPPVYYEGTDIDVIDDYLDKATKEDKEGLMYIKNNVWKNKRHNGILKIKKFMSADCKIIGYEEGTNKYKGMLGSFVIDYKGNNVNVGSGYSDYQRKYFWEHKEEFLGRILEVKYKEETQDKKTKLISLQFPTFICIKTDKSEPSYN